MVQQTLNLNIPTLFFDGGARGNPGKGAGAAILMMPEGEKYIVSEYLDFATSNEAEYLGLILGLKKAKSLKIKHLEIKGDSNLIINQMTKKWKVKSPNLKDLYQEACNLIESFTKVSLMWIPREDNQMADQEVNRCIDQRSKTINNNSQDCFLKLGDSLTIQHEQKSLLAKIISVPKLTDAGEWILEIKVLS